jgi:fructose-1,6-bisphosphatase/inositol monophosphatase family enzyme
MKRKQIKNIEKFLIDLVSKLNKEIELNLKKKNLLQIKKDKSIVTNLDLFIEKFIYNKIDASFKNHNVISEEKIFFHKSKNDFTWYIDPIDGTKGMVFGFPTWSNLIGLYYKNSPMVSLANFYEMKKSYMAILDKNYLYENNKLVKISKYKKNKDFKKIVINSLHVIKNSKILEKLKKMKFTLKISGMDAYNYCLFAQGKIDAIIDFNVKKIDILPLMRLIENANGKFYYLNKNKDKLDFILCREKILADNLKKKILSI